MCSTRYFWLKVDLELEHGVAVGRARAILAISVVLATAAVAGCPLRCATVPDAAPQLLGRRRRGETCDL